jgi:hypothetical protein
MQLPGKNTKPYLAIILVLAIIFFAIWTLLGIILIRGIKALPTSSQATAELVLETQPTKTLPNKTPQPKTTQEADDPAETQEPEPEPEPESGATLDPQTEKMMDRIEQQVSEVRSLTMDKRIPRKVLTSEELRVYVEEEMLEEFDDEGSLEDMRKYALLGFFERGFELRPLLEDLYSEQIAGFYKIEEGEMYVIADEELTINERLTYAHEYVHALQYANYDFEDELNYNDDACEEDSERCAAILALIEGDASFSQFKWFENFATQKDVIELLASIDDYESPVLDNAPPYLSASLMFPYDQGTKFVEHLYSLGGYDAINEAFRTKPPLSTEQIMFPERYPDDLPLKPEMPGDPALLLGEDWELSDSGAVGAWDMFLMLTKGLESAAHLDEATALDAVEGWGGDTYHFYQNKSQDEFLFVMYAVWDTEKDNQEALAAFNTQLSRRFGQHIGGLHDSHGYYALLQQGDNGFVLIITEGPESLIALYEGFKN